MKDCRVYEDWISAFLDGELSGPEQAELMEHIAACRSCQQYFDDLTAIYDAFGELPEVPVPEGFAKQVMDRVRTAEQNRAPKVRRFPQWRRWAALAACCAFVLLEIWRFQGRTRPDLPVEQEPAADDTMPQMTRVAGVPESVDDSIVMMDEELPADNGLSRMADDADGGVVYEAAEKEDVVETNADLPEYSVSASKDAPVSTPMAPARDNMVGGTLTAGGDIVRQWVEEELGLAWESGQVYALTGEQYVRLIDFLTEAGVEFRVEDGDSCWLAAE